MWHCSKCPLPLRRRCRSIGGVHGRAFEQVDVAERAIANPGWHAFCGSDKGALQRAGLFLGVLRGGGGDTIAAGDGLL